MTSFILLKKQAFPILWMTTQFLENKSNTAIEWFQNNKMMVNPDKFQAIIIDKKKKCHANETLKIGDKIIKVSSSIKLLSVQIGD